MRATCSALKLGDSANLAATHILWLALDCNPTAPSSSPHKGFTPSEVEVKTFSFLRGSLVASGLPPEVFDTWTSACTAPQDDSDLIKHLIVINIHYHGSQGRLFPLHKRLHKAFLTSGRYRYDPSWKERFIKDLAEGKVERDDEGSP